MPPAFIAINARYIGLHIIIMGILDYFRILLDVDLHAIKSRPTICDGIARPFINTGFAEEILLSALGCMPARSLVRNAIQVKGRIRSDNELSHNGIRIFCIGPHTISRKIGDKRIFALSGHLGSAEIPSAFLV